MNPQGSAKQRTLMKAIRDNETRLRGYLRRFIENRHDLEDMYQEIVTRSLEALESHEVQKSAPFVFGVARNVLRTHFERKARNLIDFVSDYVPEDHAEDAQDLDDVMDRQERMTMFGEAIDGLPPKSQRVFVMSKVYGYSHQEIARELHISVSTVEKHVATGFKRCSDELAERTRNKTKGAPVIRLRRDS